MTTAFFTEELEDEREAWKADHDAAMECRDLEKLLRRGTGIFHLIRLADEAWSRKVQESGAKFSTEKARLINESYNWWLEPCEHLLTVVEKMERSYEVEGADEFRRCYRLARNLASISVDDLIESNAQSERGETRELSAEDWGGLQGTTNS